MTVPEVRGVCAFGGEDTFVGVNVVHVFGVVHAFVVGTVTGVCANGGAGFIADVGTVESACFRVGDIFGDIGRSAEGAFFILRFCVDRVDV